MRFRLGRPGALGGKVVAVMSVGLLWLVSAGCAPGTTPIAKTASIPTLTRIALLPVIDMARVYGVGHIVRSPLTSKVYLTGQTSPELSELLAAEVEGYLRSLGYGLAFPEVVDNVMQALSANQKVALEERSLILAAARRVQADAALVGYLYRSHERQGGRFAVREPASVAYGFYLIDAYSGKTLWSGEFDETQRSLNEDLLHLGTFIQRRGEWIGAAQMATAGVREILLDFPKPQGDAPGVEGPEDGIRP